MGTEMTGPVEIRNAKGVFPPDPLWNTATEYHFEAVYENGVTMIVSNKEKMGVTFEGTEGKIYVNRGKLEAEPALDPRLQDRPRRIHLYKSDDHFRNFIDCVISREPTAAPVEVAHRSITICHLGNIAMRLNREKLRWDPRTEQIIGDDEAARMLSSSLSLALDAAHLSRAVASAARSELMTQSNRRLSARPTKNYRGSLVDEFVRI